MQVLTPGSSLKSTIVNREYTSLVSHLINNHIQQMLNDFK